MTCKTTHHLACACREQKFAVLNKAALDAACELDTLKNVAAIGPDAIEAVQQIINRIYSASDALNPA